MRKRIIFRADGGPNIGMGHFIRTLALAEMLKDDFYCIYATKSPTIYQINEISKVCKERIDLPSDNTHFNVFINLLAGDEIIVLDNYYFSTEYQHLIKNKGCKLVCIDDMHDQHFVADVIINHAEGISKSLYSTEKYTSFCFGYKFALLRQDYLTNVSIKIPSIFSCLVMMGGSDPFNLTAKIVSMIEPLQLPLPIAAIVGAGYNNEYLFKSFKNIELFKGIESFKVYQLMQASKLGILPASTVAIEACAARLPFICGYYVDNQKEIYNGIKTHNLGFCIGNYLRSVTQDFVKAFTILDQKGITEKMVQKQKALLDKKSRERFINTFMML